MNFVLRYDMCLLENPWFDGYEFIDDWGWG